MAPQRPATNSLRPAHVLILALIIFIPGYTLHRLHWHAATRSHYHYVQNAQSAGDVLPGQVSTSECPKATCPDCPTCPQNNVACPACPQNLAVESKPCPEPRPQSVDAKVGSWKIATDIGSAENIDWGASHGQASKPIVMLTFGNSAVWPMLSNWIANIRLAGLESSMLIGALDDGLVKLCNDDNVPVHKLDGAKAGMTGAYLTKSQADLLKYKKMAGLKAGFALELLRTQKSDVLISDSDTAWLRDPRPFFEEGPFAIANILVSTDCIDTTADEICSAHFCGCIHVSFNTGIVFLRNNPDTIKFVEAWQKKILDNNDLNIRDQAAFNDVLREGMQPLTQVPGYELYPRQALKAWNNQVSVGVLPLLYFQNGHSYFTQKLHERRSVKPYVVHATYQYGDGAVFPFGKRQRFREAGLWQMDGKDYHDGKFLAISWNGATRPEIRLALDIDTRVALDKHFAEDRYRRATVRNAFALAQVLNRTLIMPRMLCYVDHMWKEMRAGRFGGAYGMSLPFDCPTDYLYELPRFFDRPDKKLDFREPQMLNRLPEDIANSQLFVHVVPQNEWHKFNDENAYLKTVNRGGKEVNTIRVKSGMTDKTAMEQLGRYHDVRLLELSHGIEAFCGWEDPKLTDEFDQLTKHAFLKKWQFKYMETGMVGQPTYKYWVPYDQFDWKDGFEDPRPLKTAKDEPQCRK